MPLGIVKPEDYEKGLGKSKEAEVVIEKEIPSPAIAEFIKGRGLGRTEVPESIRKLIGESSVEEGSSAANAIGQFLGLSKSSVSAYSNGTTSTATYNKPNLDLATHLNKTRERITRKAAGKLFKSLNVIDDDKLEDLTALEASTVAKNMSAIIKHMEPSDVKAGNTFNGPVITFYAPRLVKEETFDVINVGE